MKVVAIALVLLQASLHSCRTYNKATPKNDTATANPVRLPSKLMQILESLDSPDAKITKIKELVPVYNDFPEFRVNSNKKHLFMPYKKKGKPLAYILKKTYVNEIVSDHTDENFDSFEDVKNNEMTYKGKPSSFRNKFYLPTMQSEKNHGKYEFPNINEIHILVNGDVQDEGTNDYDQYNKNKLVIDKSVEVIDGFKEHIILPAEHNHVHHTHRHNIENIEEKADLVSNSYHHHHGHNAKDMHLLQSEVKSDDTDSNHEQIHETFTEDKPIDSIPKPDKIEKELDQIQAINIHKPHHHPESYISIVANTNDDSLNILTTKHGHNKMNLGEENKNHKHDLIHHKVTHHTEDPHDIVKIDADELHSDKIGNDSDLTQNHTKSNLKLVVTEQKSGEKELLHSHSHSTHHHSSHKESVNDLDKYLTYLNDLDLASSKINIADDWNLSGDIVIETILNDTSPVFKENNDNNAADLNGIVPGRTKLINSQALGNSKLDSHIYDLSVSEYNSDESGSSKSGDASDSSEPSSDSMNSNQESTETDENSSTVSSENTSVYSNEFVTNESYSYSESNYALDSKSLEFDSLFPSSESASVPESNESDISGLEELPSQASNLISESVELSSDPDSRSLSEESNSLQINENLVSIESKTSELSNSGSIRSSEIALNSILGSNKSDSASENDSKSDFGSSSGYLSQSKSEESSQMDSTGENESEESLESSENQYILDPIAIASGLNSIESYLNTSSDNKLALEVFYSSSDSNATRSEASESRLETRLSLETITPESNPLHIESYASNIKNSALLDTTAINSSSVATEKSTNSSLVTSSIVETPFPDLESIISSLMSSASSLKSVASNVESSALSLQSIPGLESMASNLITTASDLVYVALNLETYALSVNWDSGLSSPLNLMASPTESIKRSELTASSDILASHLESNTSNLESLPTSESISQTIEKSPSSPPDYKVFYSRIQSSLNNNVHGAVKKDSKNRPVINNKRSNDKKTYSVSFVFNK